MKSYRRLMLGSKSVYAQECFEGGFVGADFGIVEDLSGKLPGEWRAFNSIYVPILMANFPDKSKIGAGLACGMLWTIAKGLQIGDVVLCPDGSGTYRVGEITGEYYYAEGGPLQHRRPVHWTGATIDRSAMSQELRNSTGSVGTICDISQYASEIETLVGSTAPPAIIVSDPDIEDPYAFAMERHLEDFLVQNWAQTEIGKEFDVYREEGEVVGKQYLTDTGPLDILAVSKDGKRLLVIELKRGRATDVVVGQLLRYMGYVQEELATEDQTVQGIIIALEDDQRLRRALAVTPSVDFYRYQVSFTLAKA